MSEIYFSLIIPTFRRYDLLNRAVSSVCDNIDFNGEIIIIDTNPVSDSQALIGLEKLAHNKNINLIIQHCPGCNPSQARNKGLTIAKHIYISFLDDDDYVLSNKYSVLTQLIKNERHNKCWVSHSKIINYFVDDTLPLIRKKREYLTLFQHILFDYKFGSPSFTCKKEVFDQVGNFDESLKRKQDYELLLRILLANIQIRIVDFNLLQVIDKIDRNNMPSFRKTLLGEILLWDKYINYKCKIPFLVYLMLIIETAKTIFNSLIRQKLFFIAKFFLMQIIAIPLACFSIFISLLTKAFKLLLFKILK